MVLENWDKICLRYPLWAVKTVFKMESVTQVCSLTYKTTDIEESDAKASVRQKKFSRKNASQMSDDSGCSRSLSNNGSQLSFSKRLAL